VITGVSRLEQVQQNMKAIDHADKLTNDVMQKIEEILDNKPNDEQDFRP
jgi:aryl-alcohol dehydrogenase-like predicted oxidoreductase